MADLEIAKRDGLGIATIMARKGVDGGAIGKALGIAAPTGPGRVGNEALALIGTGPGTWLAVAERASPDWAAGIAQALAGLASVSDQSGGYAVFSVVGAQARTLIQRGVFIDLDPVSFAPGSAAVTVIAHIGVILWQTDDRPGYEVAVFRSFASSLRDWFDFAAAAL